MPKIHSVTGRALLRATRNVLFALTLGLPLASPAQSFMPVSLPGTSTYDGWAALSATNYPGYPTIGTYTSAWPSPIAANQLGSDGGVLFNKVSGGGFPSNGTGSGPGIYNFMAAGTYRLYDNSPLAGLETVVAQMNITAGVGGTFTSSPVLNYNSGSQSLAADIYYSPSSQIYAYQWNLSSLGPISAYEILWTTNQHAFTNALQMNEGDTYATVVPEPATVGALMGAAALGLVIWHRRRRQLPSAA